MSTSSPRNKEDSWLPIAISVGLFLVTSVTCQFAKAFGDAVGRQNVDDGDDEEARHLEQLQRWYQSRRFYDRLSYENIHDSLPLPQNISSDQLDHRGRLPFGVLASMYGISTPPLPLDNPTPATSPVVTEWDLHHQRNHPSQRKVSTSAMYPQLLERRDSRVGEGHAAQHPNADYDFHPKNRNWRHFEHFNERDRGRHNPQTQKPSSVDTKMERPGDTKRGAADESQTDLPPKLSSQISTGKDEEGEANSVSSEGSESSEEQFVWMEHQHRHRTQDHQSNDDEKKGDVSWPTAIRNRVPSFLNLFVDPNQEPAEGTPTSSTINSNGAPLHPPSRMDPSTTTKSNSDRAPCHNNPSEEAIRNIPCNAANGDTPRRGNKSTQGAQAVELPVEMPTSFPLALQRMWSTGRSTSGSTIKSSNANKSVVAGAEGEGSTLPPQSGDHHRRMRAQYNSTIMPEKVILLRHGQSMGNINEELYSTTPDNAMPLTQLGWEQAREAGKTLKQKILASGETVHFIVSPYVRTVETFHGIVSAWCDPKEFAHIANKDKRIKAWYQRLMQMGLTWNEDSRIREQDFGNYQDPETIKRAKKERHRFGIFYYRFPHGESASDVFDRVSTFLDSLWRSFEMNKSRNYVLVTHGISIRVLLARYFRYTIDQFNILANPSNCEMVVLGHNGEGRLELQGRCALDVGVLQSTLGGGEGKEEGDKNASETTNNGPHREGLHVTGYKFHKRLRILPKQAIRKVEIRISPDDE